MWAQRDTLGKQGVRNSLKRVGKNVLYNSCCILRVAAWPRLRSWRGRQTGGNYSLSKVGVFRGNPGAFEILQLHINPWNSDPSWQPKCLLRLFTTKQNYYWYPSTVKTSAALVTLISTKKPGSGSWRHAILELKTSLWMVAYCIVCKDDVRRTQVQVQEVFGRLGSS